MIVEMQITLSSLSAVLERRDAEIVVVWIDYTPESRWTNVRTDRGDVIDQSRVVTCALPTRDFQFPSKGTFAQINPAVPCQDVGIKSRIALNGQALKCLSQRGRRNCDSQSPAISLHTATHYCGGQTL